MTTAALPTSQFQDLDTHYPVTKEQIDFFRARGYIKLKQVLSPETIEHYRKEISAKVRELNTMHLPMEKRDTYQRAFLQVGNIWTNSDIAKEFVMSKRLGRIAAELMGTRGVRLYHDQALYKEQGGGITPWHADEYYWPLASEKCCTVWVPLQATPVELGPLSFAAGSHTFTLGRDLAISDTSEATIEKAMKDANFNYVEEPFDLGEVSFHYGWTFHRAGPNNTSRPREVMTIIYIDQDMRVAKPVNKSQQYDWDGWLPGTKIGEIAASPLNPVIYSKDE
jgi:ectoine hydroxylase-related dioxygenase (phytanoyl-CoA dioxygenase family)